jgi:Predicted Zn peptidase
MSTLDRGFKSWCERRAESLRLELGLARDGPIDVFVVAHHLGVTLLTPSSIEGFSTEDLNQLVKIDAGGWSAVTLTLGSRTIIIYNPTHSRRRTASDLSHELAHILLDHDGAKTVLAVGVPFLLRDYDAKQEEEANWLGWTLLLPRIALLRSLEEQKSMPRIASDFGVSESLVTFRIQKTGADRQFHRRRTMLRKTR